MGADDPLVIAAGEGSWLIDEHGTRYLDGNASLWVNVHGHRRPEIDAAVREQLDRIAHTTFLGLTNPPAVAFADALLADGSGRAHPRLPLRERLERL